ncbi:hypothetical protein COT72_05245 [archaeon CG10_big_fil_rev_8_21_14_0_10_43_11]|nr:MAG: hypothetical protein COT72_05245 [archaeon CG10_big_fil_rev_8_21_14_0_10_43_11]
MILEQYLQPVYDAVISITQLYGLPGFFVAMILQSIIAPIPSEALLILGGASFGWLWGGIIGSLGETAGAVIGFYIARKGGRPVAERFLGKTVFDFADKWFDLYGAKAVIIGRLIPVVPFDAVSYGAGMTKIKFSVFIIATAITSFPRAFFFTLLGDFVADTILREGFISGFNKAFILIGSIALTLFVFQHVISRKMKKQPLISFSKIRGFAKTYLTKKSNRDEEQ